jgi:hypothetical protein
MVTAQVQGWPFFSMACMDIGSCGKPKVFMALTLLAPFGQERVAVSTVRRHIAPFTFNPLIPGVYLVTNSTKHREARSVQQFSLVLY